MGWVRPFYTIWTAQAFSAAGSRVVQFALIWWLTTTTGSAVVLTSASLAGLLPMLLLAPFIGVYVDRWERRLVLIVSDTAIALVTLLLALLFALGLMKVSYVFFFLAVRAVGGCFYNSAMQASIALLVPPEHLTRVQGMNMTFQGTLNIISAPLGALLLAYLPIKAILLIDVMTFLPSLLVLLIHHIPQPPLVTKSRRGQKTKIFDDLLNGLKYIWNWPGLLGVIMMISFVNLLITPIHALLPLLVSQYFHGQAKELALLESSFGVGVVCGGLVLGAWRHVMSRVKIVLVGVVCFGGGFLLVGLSPQTFIGVATIGLLTAGFANAIANGPFTALIQAAVRLDMQGRIFSLITTLAMGAGPLGLLIAGPAAEILGVRLWFQICGVICLLTGIGGFFIPAFKKIGSSG